MPDPPDKDRPSSPLTVEDADRLADSFTAFWEDAGVPAAPALLAEPTAAEATPAQPTAAEAAPAQPTAAEATPSEPTHAEPTPDPGAVTAPMPVVEAVRRPKQIGKQTLIGIAPINIERTIEKPAPSEPIQSSPEVPGYAIAYTPKDSPSTPAVVIAPEAQSSPEHEPPPKKREFSQTIPSRVRSAPEASVAPLPAPVAADDFDPYAPKRKSKGIGLALGGVALLLAGVVGMRMLSGGSREPQAESAPRPDIAPAATAVATAPTPVPTEPALSAEPIPTAAEPGANKPESALAVRRATDTAPSKGKAKAKAKPVAAAARPVTRAPVAEPSPPPTKPASKGVIVRDAPF